MLISQALLQRELDARIGRHEGAGDTVVLAVLRSVHVATYAEGALAFAVGLAPERAAAWVASSTRTVLLAGNPRNLGGRHPPDHVTADGSVAWYGPGPAAAYKGLRRLLRALEAPATVPGLRAPIAIRVPGPAQHRCGRRRRLHLDIDGISLQEHLVHLNHALCEAALDGRLRPGDTVHLTQESPPAPPWDHARVGSDPRDGRRLRLFAALTTAVDVLHP